MFTQLITSLLMYVWNYFVDYQKPVEYSQVETNNNYRFKVEKDEQVLIIEVKQLKLSRIPKKPFRSKVVYLYEVTQYAFKDGVFTGSINDKYPEFCTRLFRNTKIPHLMAVNAFLGVKES